jgi:hypothetical protein
VEYMTLDLRSLDGWSMRGVASLDGVWQVLTMSTLISGVALRCPRRSVSAGVLPYIPLGARFQRRPLRAPTRPEDCGTGSLDLRCGFREGSRCSRYL